MTIPQRITSSRLDPARFPFLFGAQYYRAPTPEPDCWEGDLQAMQDLGFNAVKFFVQWRWSHRSPERFYFNDLERLMDLAHRHRLAVTLNFILDVAPAWLYEVYPDAKQVDIQGRVVEPYVVAHRQIGGHPGPCYNHPGALAERQGFVSVAIAHFRDHPALQMWDVWNEPELCFPQRTPSLANLVCYCPHCAQLFRSWLRNKYASGPASALAATPTGGAVSVRQDSSSADSALERLNTVWGRCYETWEQVELPRGTGTFTDFIDWREFHLDTMANEAAWRLDTVWRLDPQHGRYLHVVPNLWFSAVTCDDDFAMAKHCEVFAATMNGQPAMFQHVLSAGHGKLCYNVESHLNFGSTAMHQRVLGLPQVLADFLPQIGAGIKGFLFWQYRAETFGGEAPAWGLVRTDGSPRPITAAVQQFWAILQPYANELRHCFPAPAEIGLWRSRQNEIFHFCLQGQVKDFNAAIEAYIQALYWNNLPHRLINSTMLAAGELEGIKLLILPHPYYLSQAEADGLNRWVQAGGVLLCEAHLAGYNGSTGRHSRQIPGCGLAEVWGLREVESTAPRHLRFGQGQESNEQVLPEDVRKALKDFGAYGAEYFPIQLAEPGDHPLVWGAYRYAELEGAGLEPWGSFNGARPCLASKAVGRGRVVYCGTNLGQAAGGMTELPFRNLPQNGRASLTYLIQRAAAQAGISPTGGIRAQQPGTVHLDLLADARGPRFMVMVNASEQPQIVQLALPGRWRGLFSQCEWNLTELLLSNEQSQVTLDGNFADLFIAEQ